MEQNMKQQLENAKALAGAVHDIAHAVAHRQVCEVITTQSQLTGRVSELEDDMSSAEGNLKHMMNMVDEAMNKINARIDEVISTQTMVNAALSREMHEAVANITTPDDERTVKHEKRTHHLEKQMSEVIRLFGEVGQLD